MRCFDRSNQQSNPMVCSKPIIADLQLLYILINTIVIFRYRESSGLTTQMLSVHSFFLNVKQEACCPFVGTLPVCVPSLVALVTVLVVAGEAGLVAVAGLG